MKRIKADEVVRRYKELNWKPIQDEFYSEINGQPCGCGLAVMVGDVEKASKMEDSDEYPEWLGIDPEYADGFIRGFDGTYCNPDWPPNRILGHIDGHAAWEAVSKEVTP